MKPTKREREEKNREKNAKEREKEPSNKKFEDSGFARKNFIDIFCFFYSFLSLRLLRSSIFLNLQPLSFHHLPVHFSLPLGHAWLLYL